MKVIIPSYLLAIIIGYVLATFLPFQMYLNLLIADIVMTLIIWIFSISFKNSSIYDPYWSLIPLILISYYAIYNEKFDSSIILLLISVTFWAVRLTFNWFVTFNGIKYQDWRYDKFKAMKGWFWSNLFGIHLMPTLIVYGVMVNAFIFIDNHELNLITILGFIISIIGILFELFADETLRRFKEKKLNTICRVGIWNISRHPNYLGEITFWFGIYFMMLGSNYDKWYFIIGPIILVMLFTFISIPMMEKRIQTKEGFLEYKKEVSMLWPYK